MSVAARRAGASRAGNVGAFLAAALLVTALGSIVQTQFNLAALRQLGVPVPFGVRVQATLHDLGSFTLIYMVVVILALLPALWVASLTVRVAPRRRELWYTAACGTGMLVAFLAVDALTPVPGFIAATRTAAGTLALAATAAAGGWLYARLTRPTRCAPQ